MCALGEIKWGENGGLIFYSSSISSLALPYRMGIWKSDKGDKGPVGQITAPVLGQDPCMALAWFCFITVVFINVGRNEYVFGILLHSTAILSFNKISLIESGYVSHWSYISTFLSWWGITSLEPVGP